MNFFFIKQLYILTQDELKQLLLRKKAFFTICLYGILFFLIFLLLAKFRSFILNSLINLPLDPEHKKIMQFSLSNFTFPKEFYTKNPLFSISLPLLVYFFSSFLLLPLLIPIISCDMISQDLSKGTQRFLLFRVTRSSYYWSKTLSHFIFYICIQLVILLGTILFCFLQAKQIITSQFFMHSIYLSLRLIPLIIIFLSYTQMISSQISSPIKSLIINNIGLLIFVIILNFHPVLSIFYHHIWIGLIKFDITSVSKSILGISIWSIVFFGFSFSIFANKKL